MAKKQAQDAKAPKKPVSRTDVKKMIAEAKRKSKAEFKKVKDKLKKAEKDIESFIDRNPKKAALIAAGIGATIAAGITAAIKMHKKK